MADTVATLSTTLQGQIAAGGPQPLPAMAATMVQLYGALIQGVVPMLASRISRRVGILNGQTGSQWNMLIGGSGVGDVAQNFTECRECSTLYGALQGFSGNIAKINQSDPAVILANVPAASIIAWANALVTFAATYEALEVEVLPA